jgi:hypothetical protein
MPSDDLSQWYVTTCEGYVARARAELQARWDAWALDMKRVEVHEVIGGLLARQTRLAIQMSQNSGIWNPEIGTGVLRMMVDAHLTIAWILLEPVERARAYVRYGLGQEKLHLEHLKAAGHDQDAIEARERWINEQRFTFLTEVNVGAWSGSDTRSMADEAGLLDLYRFRYQPLSATVHSMWSHVEHMNLIQCRNPLHRYHRIPCADDLPPDIGFWDSAAQQLAETFAHVDEKLGLSVTVDGAHAYFEAALEEYAARRQAAPVDDATQ